jgi:hypothetical protein
MEETKHPALQVVDKRHHQQSEEADASKTAPENPEASKNVPAPDQFDFNDLQIGLLMGVTKEEGGLVFKIFGDPTILELLGMKELLADQVGILKDRNTTSRAKQQDNQFLALSQTMGAVVMEMNGLKQAMNKVLSGSK